MEGGGNIQEHRRTDIDSDTEGLISESNDEEPLATGCLGFFSDPRRPGHRFIALYFMCFLGFGSYFCFDNPAALQNHIQNDLNITVPEYTMLYSVYSWPNVILCFIGGFLIDRVFGIRLGANLYMTITFIGQLIFATGVYCNQYWLMICGRFIFGIGGESLAVAQNNYAVLWFKGKELNMVFGLQLSFARVGSTVNFLVMESIYNWVHKSYIGPQGLGIVLFMATITCVWSMKCSLILGCLDKRAERILRRNDEARENVARLSDIKDFKATFWLLTVICVTYYVTIFPFISLAKAFFMEKFKMDSQAANSISSIVYLISAVASPILGLVIDKTGKNIFWIIGATITTIVAHTLLAFSMINPYVGMVMMGVAYSALASSLWPLVSLIVPEYQLGTAYGVCQSIQNLGLAVSAIIAGQIVHNWGYTILEIFFISCLAGALLTTLVLWVLDLLRKSSLNMTPSKRLAYQQSILAAEVLEREKVLASSSASTTDLLQPNSDFHIRNSSPPPMT